MKITVRPAREDDLASIVDLESRPQFAEYILRWDVPRHQDGMRDPDKRYFVAQGMDRSLTAFAIIAGARSPHRNVELVRVLCADPGKGVGRAVLRQVIDLAFDEIGAHRLWLDVFTDNDRARHVYRILGFKEEGVLREAVLRDGQWRSLVVMSMLESEHHAARKRAN
jgi:RimJ/RimL family protein N-acetyltransferase